LQLEVKTAELFCGWIFKTQELLCGRIFKPQELVWANILVREDPYQDGTHQGARNSRIYISPAPALIVRSIKATKLLTI